MLRLAIIGDVHYSTAGPRDSSLLFHHSQTLLKTALEQIARNPKPPDLVVQIGDLIDGADQTPEQARADLDRAVALFDQSGLRWTWILGNHDVAFCRNRRWLLRRLRRTPSYGELVFGDKVLLLLDSACEEIYGRVDAEQQAWLDQALDLHRRRRIFVFIHHVFDWSFDDDMYIEEGDSVRTLLLESPAVKAVFMGHAHTFRIETTEGLHEITTGALTTWPTMFRWIEIAPDRLSIQSEKVAVSREIEAEALAAFKAHPKPWYGTIGKADLSANLVPRR
jgi:3',5'-cyclic AMP phosphodiesterase CpdA